MFYRKVCFAVMIAVLLVGAALPVFAQDAVTARTTANLRLRAGAGLSYSVITVIPYNSTLTASAITADRGWVFVTYQNQNGWVARRYLRLVTGSWDSLPNESSAPASQPAQQPQQSQAQPAVSASTDQAGEVLGLVNAARASAGLAPLNLDAALNAAAARQAADQAANNFLGHTGSDGSDPGSRASAAGYSWSMIGENAAQRWDVSASGVMDQWMGSAGHRQNILTPEFTDMGLAFATAADGKVYYTMVLGRH